MADFDVIYEEEDEEERYYEESLVVNVPDPVVIRGAGNITVLVIIFVYLLHRIANKRMMHLQASNQEDKGWLVFCLFTADANNVVLVGRWLAGEISGIGT